MSVTGLLEHVLMSLSLQRHGNGTFMESDGSTYVGEWVAGHREGKGVMTYVNGAKYDGSWSNDKYHKNGSYLGGTNDSIKQYDGEWNQGRMHGKGSLTLRNGDTFKGTFKDGRFHGTGTYIYADGTTLTGKWTNGVREGKHFLSLDKKYVPPCLSAASFLVLICASSVETECLEIAITRT
jgi:hypothetical protein